MILGNYWLGATLGSSNQFYWLDGMRLDQGYMNWKASEARGDHGDENCLVLRTLDHMWGDVRHTANGGRIVCEYGPV